MPNTLPLHRFAEFGRLTDAETAAVVALAAAPMTMRGHQTIRREGDPAKGFYLLLDGWAASSITLPDGARQILKVHLPGDVLGSPSMCSDETVETLSTITPAVICPVSLAAFGALLQAHPRLGGYFLLSVQYERLALMDQLASMGRTSAEARLAAFLVDLAERLAPLGLVKDDRFQLALTQEEMGDALGLTSVHVNRVLRALERKGLIARDRQMLSFLDRAGLIHVAARSIRPKRSDLSWLPPSRGA